MPPERHLTSPTAPTAKNKKLVSFASIRGSDSVKTNTAEKLLLQLPLLVKQLGRSSNSERRLLLLPLS
jgi:hypothetical protein